MFVCHYTNLFTFAHVLRLRNFYMNPIDSIRKPVLKDLKLFDETFVDAMKSDNPLLSGVNDYILERAGKKLRPTLVLLAARLMGEVNMSTIYGSLAIELLHTASLVHDDVVDDTSERRGRPSIQTKWTNKVAILSGDYMLSNALAQVAKAEKISILRALSFIGMQLSDGELLQLVTTQQSKFTEEDYYKIIQKKTAFLFATCTEVGALSVEADEKSIQHIRQYGEYLGLCFQIKDDIFDYYADIQIGKPTGNDLRDGKVTLPLIYALKVADEVESQKIISIIDKKDFTEENIDLITQFAHDKGGVTYAIQRMQEFKQKAIDELQGFADSEIRQALIDCAEFAVSRLS